MEILKYIPIALGCSGLALLSGLLIYLLVRKASWVRFLRKHGLLEKGKTQCPSDCKWLQLITHVPCAYTNAECLFYRATLSQPWGTPYKCRACELRIHRFDKDIPEDPQTPA